MAKVEARHPNDVKNDIVVDSLEYDKAKVKVSQGERGAIIGTLNRYLGGEENRHTLGYWLFGSRSSKDWTDGEFAALFKWIGFYQQDGEWLHAPAFAAESMLCLTEAIRFFQNQPLSQRPEDMREENNMLDTGVAYLDGVATAMLDIGLEEYAEIAYPEYGVREELLSPRAKAFIEKRKKREAHYAKKGSS